MLFVSAVSVQFIWNIFPRNKIKPLFFIQEEEEEEEIFIILKCVHVKQKKAVLTPSLQRLTIQFCYKLIQYINQLRGYI